MINQWLPDGWSIVDSEESDDNDFRLQVNGIDVALGTVDDYRKDDCYSISTYITSEKKTVDNVMNTFREMHRIYFEKQIRELCDMREREDNERKMKADAAIRGLK